MAPPPMPEMAPSPQPESQPQAAGVRGIADPRFRDALNMLSAVLFDEPDPKDSSDLAGIIAKLEKLAADRVQETDDMMSGKMSPRALRRP
jgi:hypothetical protein